VSGKNYIMRNLMICTAHDYYLGDQIEHGMSGACGGEERCIQGFGGKPEGKRPLVRPKRRWEDNIKWIFRKWDEGAWIRLIWLRIGMGGRIL
jgi:hypothetical protein